jgi:hypothetical protein
MTSGTARLVVKDQAASTLVSQEISSTVTQKVSLQFFVNSSVTSIQLSIESVSAPVGLKIDDLLFTDSPFVAVDLVSPPSMIQLDTRGSGAAGYGSTNTAIGRFTNTQESFGSDIIYADSATLGASFTIVTDGTYHITHSGVYDSTAHLGISKNSTELTTSIASINVLHRLAHSESQAGVDVESSWSGFLRAGDVIRPHGAAAVSVTVRNARSSFTIAKAGTITENLVFSQSGTENTFSARITSAGSIVSQSYPWISSITKGAAGIYTLNLVSGFFTVAPSANGVSEAGTGRNLVLDGAPTTTSIVVRTTTAAGTLEDNDFSILVQRQGSDYKNPNAYAVVPSVQVAYLKDVKSSGTDGGTFTSGSYQTRTLNTLEGDNFVQLTNGTTGTDGTANRFILPAGKYLAEGFSSAYLVQGNKLRLYNVTDSSIQLLGMQRFNNDSGEVDQAIISGVFEIASSKTFELQHRCQITIVSNGLGVAVSFGDNETHSQIKITKLR